MNHLKNIAIYKTKDGRSRLEVTLKNNTIWLSQRQMAELFEKDSDTIGLHLKNVYKTHELNMEATTEDFSVVQFEGNRKVKRTIKFCIMLMALNVLLITHWLH